MRCVENEREKLEKEEKVKVKRKEAFRYFLCHDPHGNGIPYRRKKG
jgi:hypothetical protein